MAPKPDAKRPGGAECPAGRCPQDQDMLAQVGKKERKRLRAAKRKGELWFGMGTFGMVGWLVAIPTFLMAFLGNWLDREHPGSFSWTLSLMFLGLCVGGANAWMWLHRERRHILKCLEDEEGCADDGMDD